MDEHAAPRTAEPGGSSAAGETGPLLAGVREESGGGASRPLSAAATQATSSQSTPTHRDREREARALALAGLRLVPLLARVASVFVEGGSPWFGYADLGDFTREILGRSARWLRDLAELGAGLKRLAGLEAVLLGADGGPPLGRVAARCVARTASAETLAEWVVLARQVPVRELLEAARAARQAGSDRPLAVEAAAQVRSGANGGPGAAFMPTGAVEDDDSESILSEVLVELPVPVDVAVDEVRDLHRAVGGRESSLVSLVEALVGEAFAGPHPPDAELVPVSRGVSRAEREALLARVNAGWKHLDASREVVASPGTTALARDIEQVLEQVVSIEAAVTWNAPSVVVAGWQLRDLVAIEDRLERLLGRTLHAMSRHGDWSQLGFSGVGHYAEQRLGLGRRTAESRAGIVGALAGRPKIRAAYTSGAIGLESAWLLVRVLGRGPVDPEIEAAWVKCARTVSLKRLRDEVRRARWESCGAEAPPPPRARKIETTSGTGPASEEATEPGSEVEAEGSTDGVAGSGDETRPAADLDALPTSAFEPRPIPRTHRPVVPLPATDAEWQASLRRWPGRTRERVWRLGNHAIENPGAVVCRRFRLPQDLAGLFLSAIESERCRLEQQAQRQVESGTLPHRGAQPTVRAAHQFADRLRRVPAWVGLLSLLEDFAHTWDDPRRIPSRRWRRIYERENYRCAAPGCTRSAGIEDHHIDYRSDMGSDEPWNQTALCKFHHHQGEHGRFARVRGTAPLDLVWRLGVPQLASWWRNETRIDPQDGRAIDARTIERALAV